MSRKYELIGGRLVQTGGEPESENDRQRYGGNITAICESRKAPGVSTDSTFFAGVGSLKNQIKDKRARKRLAENARKMGVHLTGNEFYQPGLARFPGDPMACISHADGKAEIRKRVIESGSGCEGAVNVKPREALSEPKPKFKVHPRIVREEVRKLKADPANARVDPRELSERVIDKFSKK